MIIVCIWAGSLVWLEVYNKHSADNLIGNRAVAGSNAMRHSLQDVHSIRNRICTIAP